MSYSGIQESYKFPERASPIRSNGFDRGYGMKGYDARDSPTMNNYMDVVNFFSSRSKEKGPYHNPASENAGHSLGGDVRIVSRAA